MKKAEIPKPGPHAANKARAPRLTGASANKSAKQGSSSAGLAQWLAKPKPNNKPNKAKAPRGNAALGAFAQDASAPKDATAGGGILDHVRPASRTRRTANKAPRLKARFRV